MRHGWIPRLTMAVASTLACASQSGAAPVVHTVEVTRLVPAGAGATPAAPGEGRLLLEGTFERGAGAWFTGSTAETTIRADDGALVIEVREPNWAALSGHAMLEAVEGGFDLTLTVTLLGGPVESFAAVDFRYLDEDNFAELGLNGDGEYALSLMYRGDWFEVIPWTRQRGPSHSIHVVRLIDSGRRVRAFANEAQLFDLPFEDLPPGPVTFGVVTFEAGGARWAFDGITLREFAPR